MSEYNPKFKLGDRVFYKASVFYICGMFTGMDGVNYALQGNRPKIGTTYNSAYFGIRESDITSLEGPQGGRIQAALDQLEAALKEEEPELVI
jgi:hypothetical protein